MFIRVSHQTPCPVCGKPDWCARNDKVVICMRVPSERPSQNGGWVHRLKEKEINEINFIPSSQIRIRRKPDSDLDRIYRKLLNMLSLSPSHASHLRSRGMNGGEIERGGYRTLPEYRQHILSRFSAEEMSGVPGFGLKKGHWILTGRPGILIPVVQNGLIVSLLIRPDNQSFGRKYQILSSSWLEEGSSPGARIHVAVPSRICDPNTAWIVEGPLKGNIVAERVGAVTYCVPGVNSWKELKDMSLPKTIIVAYDSDYENFHVRYHARKLSNWLIKQGHEVYAALWEGYKGPDDALINEIKIKFYRLFWRSLPSKEILIKK